MFIKFRHGPYCLTIESIMMLEITSNISSDQLATLKKIDNSFKPGWLQDEVIGSYLFNLVRQHEKVKYCG